MSLSLIIEFVVLAVILAIGVALVYVIFEMREVYSDSRDQFVRALSGVNDVQKVVLEMGKIVQLAESDGRALQGIAMQIERAVADLDRSLTHAISTSAEKHDRIIAQLGDDLDLRDSKLLPLLERMESTVHDFTEAHAPRSRAASADDETIGREVLDHDSKLRFKLLDEWVNRYLVAILRRASRPWTAPQQLVEGIPYRLRPETEVLGKDILLIGTKDWTERIAVLLSGTKPTMPFAGWFQSAAPASLGNNLQNPAVVVRANGVYTIVRPGLVPQFPPNSSDRVVVDAATIPLPPPNETPVVGTGIGS